MDPNGSEYVKARANRPENVEKLREHVEKLRETLTSAVVDYESYLL